MKKRSIIVVLSALVSLAPLPIAQAAPAPETPDPGSVGGSFNTADGDHALFSVTTGLGNAAFGWFSLLSNIDGSNNTAVGAASLLFNIGDQTTGEGQENTAVGAAAMLFNTTGSQNTAVAAQALELNDSGIRNTAIGSRALINNLSGDNNTAVGRRALEGIISGDSNTAVGWQAGFSATGNNNIYIGANMFGVAGENNTCYIGNIYSNLQPVVGTDPDLVTITSGGKLGRSGLSSRRYKHDIEPMDKASEVVFALKPMRFRYNKELDATQTIAFGLIAEEVAEVAPALVGRNPKGEPESVRYEQINAMLLNEFLKEHKKVKDLEATVAQQQKGMEVLTAQLKEQAAQIQKVSAQLEMSKPAPQVVASKP